jgi:hypothetical protein
MNTPATANPVKSDVLQSDHHSHFSSEEIAKAIARHNREHPKQVVSRTPKLQKTTPLR